MPLISKEEQLRQQRNQEYMADELERYRPYYPFLDIAKDLKEEVERLIAAKYPADGSAPDPETFSYEFDDIGELAAKNIAKRLANQAREELTARYEQQHRERLYKELIEKLDEDEGKTIEEDVRKKVESDPELALELRESARKELSARAIGAVSAELTKAQEVAVNEEAERQMDLDRLDVDFALEGELDLLSDKVRERIEVGDKLVIYYEGDTTKSYPITFTWTKDANKHEGWVMRTTGHSVAHKETNNAYYAERFDAPDDMFVTIGVVNKDMQTGKDVVQNDKIVQGLQLAITNVKGKRSQLLVGHTNYDRRVQASQTKPLTIASTDFQTRDLIFSKEDK